MLTVCQESRRLALKTIETAIQDSVQVDKIYMLIFVESELIQYFCNPQAYMNALVTYYDRTLQSVQSKYDFAPKYDSGSIGIEPTGACKKVCTHLKEIVQV